MTSKKLSTDFPFYQALRDFYIDKKGSIKRHYKDITKKFLDYNDKEKNPNAFLRKPQFEALEIYIMIKEYLDNEKVKTIFTKWYHEKEQFEGRIPYSRAGQISFIDEETKETFSAVFDQMDKNDQIYPNYIYALTMGTGKTILMATCIFYEFLLANKFPRDPRYVHNALVFAPDKTVLQSLKEIKTFDLRRVVPLEYVDFLYANLKFHFMDESGMSLTTTDGSDFNIIISNTQKIILKVVHKEKSAVDKLRMPKLSDLDFDYDDFTKKLYGDLDSLKDEKEVTINQRFEKIIRLNQLGIYVDEAHHLFGSDLKSSLSDFTKETSLRYTINQIAKRLEMQGTRLVACYNYTGTPYVENRILPEVVYAYSLKDAISHGYLKQVEVQAYENVKNTEFLKETLENFFNYYADNLYEGLKPKIAIFGSTIDEVVEEIKPAVEGILNDIGIDLNTILVNVGDSVITKDADIRNFNNLDVVGTEGNDKQIILLVNKGREGWNCRSLFAVALFRSPKSKVFVLQSTMRCLRSITEKQQIAHVYLSKENYVILDSELKKNFNVTIKEVTDKKDMKIDYLIKINFPVKIFNIPEIKKNYLLKENNYYSIPFVFNTSIIDVEKYKVKKIIKKGLDGAWGTTIKEIISSENRDYSFYEIVFEIARYLNINPLKIESVLIRASNKDEIVNLISKYNDILYEELIPAVFRYLYTIEEKVESTTRTVPLIKYPKGMDHFNFRSNDKMTVQMNDTFVQRYTKKSFHTDRYCFDSEPEKKLFIELLESNKVKEVYFTGMFTGSENGLSVQYIDPGSNAIRNYYPDILVIYKDDSMEIIEVKGDNRIDSKEVEAKAYAMMTLAQQCGMSYDIVKSSEIMNGRYIIKSSSR